MFGLSRRPVRTSPPLGGGWRGVIPARGACEGVRGLVCPPKGGARARAARGLSVAKDERVAGRLARSPSPSAHVFSSSSRCVRPLRRPSARTRARRWRGPCQRLSPCLYPSPRHNHTRSLCAGPVPARREAEREAKHTRRRRRRRRCSSSPPHRQPPCSAGGASAGLRSAGRAAPGWPATRCERTRASFPRLASRSRLSPPPADRLSLTLPPLLRPRTALPPSQTHDTATMSSFTARKKIVKERGAEPDAFEQSVAQVRERAERREREERERRRRRRWGARRRLLPPLSLRGEEGPRFRLSARATRAALLSPSARSGWRARAACPRAARPACGGG